MWVCQVGAVRVCVYQVGSVCVEVLCMCVCVSGSAVRVCVCQRGSVCVC